jgi:hypothetical protein
MTAVGLLLTLLALIGMVVLRESCRPLYVVGLLCLATSWFLPVVLSLAMQQGVLTFMPWPAGAIVNVVLSTVGGGLLVLAAIARGAGDRRTPR